MTIAKWDMFEAAFTGPAAGNPFVDVGLSAEYRIENRVLYADGL